ncbi:ABC transporter ATP-binding protein [Paenalkalicoccus suaedae]|uniref:ABC transporter ATP-binding protein n=1 Tax=Paenalkalicoccus suaedae TaxID=2592382 RepID=A0A859FF64_9BACI|nr:ABC transporter ATP-binding protein [Paenalkalicoccus suaedae]QKS71342.1 ABC transporter ATP-binding protein [Paenalkalicoccus suaedae]
MKDHDYLAKPLPQKQVFKRLMGYAKAHWKLLTIAMLLLIAGTSGQLIGPILVQIFIDDYLTVQNLDVTPLAILGGLYLFLHIGSAGVNYIQLYLFQKIALAIIQQVRVDVFTQVEKLGLSFFDRFPTGGLISRITNDTEQIKELYVTVLATFIQNIVFLIGIFIAMFYLNAQLALFCLFILPIILLVMQLYRKYSSVYYANMSERLSQLNARVNETIQGMSIVQMFRQEKRMNEEFKDINQQHNKAWFKSMQLDGLLLRPAIDLISIIALVIVLSYFGIASFTGPVEIGVIYAFVNYLDRFFEPVNQMMQRLSMFQQAMISAGRVFRLMDHDEPAPKQSEQQAQEITRGDIEFRNVSFSYDGVEPILSNVSFKVNQGETLAIVGHTGSGKSSIINALMRFYPHKEGNIMIDGHPLASYSDAELRKKLGLVLQDPFLFVGDIASNIRLYDEQLTDEDVRHAAEFVRASTFIGKLDNGYKEPVLERGSTLSSGERQLISFARTVVRDPRILILDEATASIDTETEQDIQLALTRMAAGRTTIAIAHRLSTIKHANHIIVLHKGKIAEEGTHESLLRKQGLYEKMYRLQKGKESLAETSM